MRTTEEQYKLLEELLSQARQRMTDATGTGK